LGDYTPCAFGNIYRLLLYAVVEPVVWTEPAAEACYAGHVVVVVGTFGGSGIVDSIWEHGMHMDLRGVVAAEWPFLVLWTCAAGDMDVEVDQPEQFGQQCLLGDKRCPSQLWHSPYMVLEDDVADEQSGTDRAFAPIRVVVVDIVHARDHLLVVADSGRGVSLRATSSAADCRFSGSFSVVQILKTRLFHMR
jgi:hypothetical protein